MNFSRTDQQTMLHESVARLLERSYDFDTRQKLVRAEQPWSKDVWQTLAEAGILGLPFAEEAGGFGGSMSDIVTVSELFGAHLLVEPFVSSVLLAGQCLAFSDNEVAQGLLAQIISGEKTAAFAHEEGKGTARPALVSMAANAGEDGFTLHGDKRMVLGGAEADVLVVSARTQGHAGDANGLSVFMVNPASDGVQVSSFDTIDGRRAAHVTFDSVQVSSQNMLAEDAGALLEKVISQAVVALCAEAVGAMETLLRLTSVNRGVKRGQIAA